VLLRNLLLNYKNLEKHILLLITAEFFIQLINASFMLVLNIHMSKYGYTDPQIADFISYRFLGVLVLALPLGLYIKGRKLKPMFYFTGITMPLASLAILYAVFHHLDWLLYTSLCLWGVSFTTLQVSVLPYILRNAKKETHSEAISLNYTTWSLSTIVSGFIMYFLTSINPDLFDENLLLSVFGVAGFISIYFLYKISFTENVDPLEGKRYSLRDFDWLTIAKALIPTTIIAVGAGLTIPFVNLFFYSVHNVDYHQFSIIGSVSAILVVMAAISIPQIKRKHGYRVAITLFQSIAVIALVLMATTEFFSHLSIAVYFAVFFFLIRQPFMNMAGPMTSELVMNYVGKRNREMVSALNSAIWSGSWYISSRIFMHLRELELSYAIIFYITAALYAGGVIWYHILISDYNRKIKSGLIAV
jgi:fucose permease